MTRLLLIDDDVQLTGLLAEYLTKDGLDVTVHNSAMGGLACLRQSSFDLLILDVMMPVMDGITLLREVRHSSSIPVIMLTARGDDLDKVVGLELGADDYVAKPCLPRELTARIKAILRRVQHQQQYTELQCGELNIRSSSRTVYLHQQKIALTGAEFSILYLLAQKAGQVISKAELSEQALGKPLCSFDRSIDVHISHIRQKLGPRSEGQQWITAVRGKGYQFIYSAAS